MLRSAVSPTAQHATRFACLLVIFLWVSLELDVDTDSDADDNFAECPYE